MILLYKSNIWETPKYNDYYKSILDFNDIPYEESNLSDPDFWSKVKKCDYFIYRYVNTEYQIQEAESVLPVIENILDKKVFPNSNARWHYDDKIKQFYLLRSKNFPIINTHVFWDYNKAIEWVNKTDLPKIFKLKSGAGSSNVIKIEKISQAKKVVKAMFRKGVLDGKIPLGNNLTYKNIRSFVKSIFYDTYSEKKYGIRKLFWKKHMNYCLFQEYLPDNNFDTRITVIGGHAYAFLRYNRDNDFRASGSGKIEFDQDKIDLKAIKLAFEISDELGFDSMAYDFLYDENDELKLCEISYTYLDEPLYSCPGVYDRDLNFIEGNFIPGFFHLKNLLNNPDLKHPEIDLKELANL